jgi:hypothetical protein
MSVWLVPGRGRAYEIVNTLHKMVRPEEILKRLFQLTVAMSDAMEENLSNRGLTRARATLLAHLHDHGPTIQSALARALRVSPRNLTGLVTRVRPVPVRGPHRRRPGQPRGRARPAAGPSERPCLRNPAALSAAPLATVDQVRPAPQTAPVDTARGRPFALSQLPRAPFYR